MGWESLLIDQRCEEKWEKVRHVLNCFTFTKDAQQNYQNYHCQKEQYWQTPLPEKFKAAKDPIFGHCSADSVFLKLRKLNSVALLWILFSWFPIFPWQVFWFGSWVLPLAGMRKKKWKVKNHKNTQKFKTQKHSNQNLGFQLWLGWKCSDKSSEKWKRFVASVLGFRLGWD